MSNDRNYGIRGVIDEDLSSGIVEPRLLPPSEAEPSGAQDYVSLATYWRILVKRRWTIFTVAVVVTTVTAIVSFRMTPIYKATASVWVDAETSSIQSLNDINQKGAADEAYVQTQIQVLKSQTLAWRVVEELGLAQRSAFVAPNALAGRDPERSKVALIRMFLGSLSVEAIRGTRVLIIGFESSDPRLATQVATAVANDYVDLHFREKYDATRQASGWMEQQLDELKYKVEKSQQALVAYQRENQIVSTGEKQTVVEQMLSDVSKDLAITQADRIQKESVYKQAMTSSATLLGRSPLLQKLEEKSADLKGLYAEAVLQYGPNYPKALRLQQQINENQTEIEREQSRAIVSLKNEYELSLNREKLALAAVAQQKDEVGKLNQLLVGQNILQRDFDSNQQLYQTLLQRLKDATVSAGLRSTNLHVIDTALLPPLPIRPRKTMNIAIGLLAGVVLGMMAAFGQEGFDHSVKSMEEVESLLPVPALAVIPLERGLGPATNGRWFSKANGEGAVDFAQSGQRRVIGLSVFERPKSVIAEAYRGLRTSVLLSVAPTPPKILLVTSTQPGEGKTATTLNLAQAMAQRKGPVLIVDCDLRKGGIARALDMDDAKGLSTVLTGADGFEQAVQQYKGNPNLWVLPAGPVPPNPADLLASEAIVALLKELEGRYEHVILDSPPALAVTDATILSNLVDGVLLVIESGKTPRGGLLRTYRILEGAGARILGVVVNKFDFRLERYYGSYGYGYYRSYYSKYPYGNSSRS